MSFCLIKQKDNVTFEEYYILMTPCSPVEFPSKFLRNVLPPSSGSKSKPIKEPEIFRNNLEACTWPWYLFMLIPCLVCSSTVNKEAVRNSETSINFFQIIRRHIRGTVFFKFTFSRCEYYTWRWTGVGRSGGGGLPCGVHAPKVGDTPPHSSRYDGSLQRADRNVTAASAKLSALLASLWVTWCMEQHQKVTRSLFKGGMKVKLSLYLTN
jgi:hypothetical protein